MGILEIQTLQHWKTKSKVGLTDIDKKERKQLRVQFQWNLSEQDSKMG